MASRTDHNNPSGAGQLDLTYHYEMLADKQRLTAFEQAINATCHGQRVLDCGAGTGILSLMAARAGATKVYSVDIDEEILQIAQANIQDCGFGNIDLLHKDSCKLILADLDNEPIDVVICENLSTWQVTEPIIAVKNRVNTRLVHPETIHLPAGVDNFVEPVQSQFLFNELVELRSHYFEFTGTTKPRILGEPVLYNSVNFAMVNIPHWDNKVRLKITHPGSLNSLRLTSPVRIHNNLVFQGSDTLMPPVIVPLPYDLPVEPGDIVEVQVRYEHLCSWREVTTSAKLVAG